MLSPVVGAHRERKFGIGAEVQRWTRRTSAGKARVSVIVHLARHCADQDAPFALRTVRVSPNGDEPGWAFIKICAHPIWVARPALPSFDFRNGNCHRLVRPEVDTCGFASVSRRVRTCCVG
jgi:hypothetical protein